MMAMVPSTNTCNYACFYPLWRPKMELYFGWTTRQLNWIYEYIKSNTCWIECYKRWTKLKEGPFAQEDALLQEHILVLVSCWEKFKRHVPELQAFALWILFQDCNFSITNKTKLLLILFIPKGTINSKVL